MQIAPLHLYRMMLRLADGLPYFEKISTVVQIQTEFRRNLTLTDPQLIAEEIKRGLNSLGYLRIITPKSSQSLSKSSPFHKVYPDKSLKIEGCAQPKVISNWHVSKYKLTTIHETLGSKLLGEKFRS
jgi:hypothetical protein